ncbi:MAG: SusC/RagA family TonB-linked outer membrane protein [Dysgonomonas sp.]
MKNWKKLDKEHIFKLCMVIVCLFLSGIASAQTIEVKGNVADENGEAVIGASILVKGSGSGTITDFDGNYNLKTEHDAVLVISYLGLATQEVAVNGRTTIDIVMKGDKQVLNELVVVGYGTQKKKDLTTAVSTVTSDEWADRPIISAQQALQGKAAGVQVVQPSGKPGVGMSVRVRGATSLNAGNDPLYVVDGIQTNDITNLSPNDIESMSILKDASSAAIYGARAANGVVLITTKKGTAGKSQLNVSMYAGFSNVSKQIKTLNTKDYYDLMDDIGVSVDNTNHNYINWAKEMYGTGYQQNYQVSLSGGLEKVNYYVSGGYQKETGIISPAEYDRYSFKTNVNATVKDWLKMTTNLSFARNSRQDVTDNANSGRGGVIMSILNTPPFLDIWDKENPGQYALNPFQSSWENPYAQADTYDLNMEYRFMGNFGLDFTLMKNLHFKPSVSVDFTSHTWDKYIDPVKTAYGRSANGRGEHADDDYLTWNSENILTYDTKIEDKHNLSLMAGATYQKYKHNNAYISAEDFVKGSNFSTITLNLANKINNATTSINGNTLVSYLARAQYDYESRYLLTAAMRADGSSKLHPDHRWGYFPSVSAGWRFSSEEFFKSLRSVVDDAKLRAGWGINGNQGGIGDYDYLDKYTVSKQETSGSGPAISLDRLGNKDLKWETTTQYNLGLDLSLFNSRLIAEVDVYYKKTTDLLLNIKLPSSVGVNLPMRNDGEMLNKGFEYNLTGHILTGEFKWDANLNMSFNKNKLAKLSLTPSYTDGTVEGNGDVIMIKEGLPLGTFWGYIAEGVDPETGDMIYKDIDKNGKITDNDMTIIGDAQPDFTFGFSHNFSWKDFTLSTFFQGSYGNDIFNASRIFTEGMTSSNNQSENVLVRWRRPGMITDVPRAGNSYNSYNSSRFVEDGSYLRLKTLTLSYNLSKKILKKVGVEAMSLYVTANNLYTLTKYRGYDPELNWGGNSATLLGVDMGTYPQTRSFIFGLNLTF